MAAADQPAVLGMAIDPRARLLQMVPPPDRHTHVDRTSPAYPLVGLDSRVIRTAAGLVEHCLATVEPRPLDDCTQHLDQHRDRHDALPEPAQEATATV